MHASTLLLSLAYLGTTPVAAAQEGAGALATHIDPPAVYLELFDLTQLERDVRQSGLGRLTDRLLPLFEEHMEEHSEEVLEQMGIDPLALASGDLSWEDGIATSVARLARDELGMSESDAVRVAASLGSRFSLAVAADASGSCEDEEYAVAWSLRPGGAEVILDTLVPHLEDVAGEDVPEPIHVERGASGVRAAWRLEDDVEGYVALRDDLLAITSSERMLKEILGSSPAAATRGTRRQASTDFHDARIEGMNRGDSLWVWVDGAPMKQAAAAEGEEALQMFSLFGLDGARNIQVSMSSAEGQLTSRVRLEKNRSDGLLGIFRGRACEWRGMGDLTADCVAVAGMTRPPSDVFRELFHMLGRVEDAEEAAEMWAMAEGAPLIGDLLAPGMLTGESLVFVRPGAAGIPMVYASMQSSPKLRERLDSLRDGAQAFGGEAELRVKELDGGRAWMLGASGYGLAVQSQGEKLIASYSLLALQDYQRQRSRERTEDRDRLIAGVRASMRDARLATGRSESDLAGFLHVRVEPLTELVWPWVMMGMSMGGVEGLEDLPDAIEIAEEIGDTTLILFETSDSLELRGRGLFGGLGVLF